VRKSEEDNRSAILPSGVPANREDGCAGSGVDLKKMTFEILG